MIKTLALVLKKQNLGEYDRILTILTPALGKKRVVVGGIRRPLSRLAGHLDALMISQIILTEKHDLPKVTSAVVIESFEEMRSNLIDIKRASSISKLAEKVVAEDVAQQTLFQLTVDSLARVNQGEVWSNVWNWYLWGIVRYLGVAPVIERCNECGKQLEHSAYWSEEHQQVWCSTCWDHETALFLDGRTLKLLRLLVHKDYSFVEKVVIPDEVSLTVENILLGEIAKTMHKPWREYASLDRDR